MPTPAVNLANGVAGGVAGGSGVRNRPVGSAISQYILASLIEPEKKDAIDVIERMERDYQITLAKLTLMANLQAVEVRVTTTSSDARAKFLAGDLVKLWKSNLPKMAEFIVKGRVAFEKVWAWDNEAKVNKIASLQELPYRQTEMLLDDGKFNGIQLKGKGKEGEEKEQKLDIPAQNSWWLAMDGTAVEPHGKSRLLGAPNEVYKERAQALKLRAMFVRRMVLNGGVAHVPSNAVMEDGQVIDVFQEMAKAHDARLSGGLMILDNVRDESGNYEYDITDPPSILNPAPLDDHIDGLDSEQLQAFGIPPKTVIEGESAGSFAMVSQQRLTLDAVVEGILQQLEQSFQRYVADKVRDYNFGLNSGVKFEVSHDPLLSPENAILMQVIQAILTSPELPAILKSGAVDLKAILEKSRIPLLPGAVAAIQRIFATAAATPNPEEGGAPSSAAGEQGTPGAPGTPAPADPGVSTPPTPGPNLANLANAHDAKYVPPVAARAAARKVLAWRIKYGDEVDGMTQTGWTRARQLASGRPISRKTVGRIAAFARQRKSSAIDPKFKDTPWKDAGHVCWLGWGGDAGIEWAARIVESESGGQKKSEDSK
jgi:hypothetical protein